MKSMAVLWLALVGFVQPISYSDVLEAEWQVFKLEQRKSYADDYEEQLRKQIFKDNKQLIDTHNARFEAGAETYEMGVNRFTDMLHTEFVSVIVGGVNVTNFNIENFYSPPANVELPPSKDWRKDGAVSPVKDQDEPHECGSCWAFAAVATLEGQHFLKTTKMVEFSEQNLVDCSSVAPYRNSGCGGGSPQEALRYIKDNPGINTRSSYKYEAQQGTCRFKKDQIGTTTIKGMLGIKSGDEAALQAAVANVGPISVTIDATHLQHYKSGVLNEACSGKAEYHSITAVGYGHDDKGGDYWLLKNSWGSWGEDGYFRIARNSNNLCEIASHAVYPEL